MWIVRFILLAVLGFSISAFAYFLKRREDSESLLENRTVNLLGVIAYNLACYSLTWLPSDPTVFPAPPFLTNSGTRTGFLVVGLALIAAGVTVFTVSVRRRKTVGGENVKEGLLTTGIYSFARHPIYTGIISVSFGLALALGTWDGLLMVPIVWLVNAAEAVIEELVDIGRRFPVEYAEYRKQTGMFGPVSLWAALLVFLAGLAVAGSI
ncbi:MAG: isoprenylcysteine carboxylmethyltransferase family protein [Anaerolineae bacterium]|nr:isoprenylcysteine carboxylmethyltransferase family protein [Anaerolineae bacterium]